MQHFNLRHAVYSGVVKTSAFRGRGLYEAQKGGKTVFSLNRVVDRWIDTCNRVVVSMMMAICSCLRATDDGDENTGSKAAVDFWRVPHKDRKTLRQRKNDEWTRRWWYWFCGWWHRTLTGKLRRHRSRHRNELILQIMNTEGVTLFILHRYEAEVERNHHMRLYLQNFHYIDGRDISKESRVIFMTVF